MVQAGTYRIRNAKSGTYLDESDKDKNVVHGWDSRPQNDNQKWILEPADGGFRIKNLEHGRYVSVSGRDNNAPVRATSGDKDVWNFQDRGNGRYTIALQGTEQVLDLDRGKDENGTSVSIWRYNNDRWQQWELEQVGGGGHNQPQPGRDQWTGNQPQQQYQGPIAAGTYRIHNVHAGTALDLAGGKPADGTPVIGWSVGQGSNQTWTLESGTNGYRIKNGASGTYLGYANLTQGELLVGRSQGVEWTITRTNEGNYQIHPAQNQNLVLDLAEGKKEDGAKICLWGNKNDNNNNQRWNIKGLY